MPTQRTTSKEEPVEDQGTREVMIGCGAAAPMARELRRMADELESDGAAQWLVAPNGVAPMLELRATVETGEDDWTEPLVDYGLAG